MDKLQKIAHMSALASSVVFELVAGPFLGYSIGSYFSRNGVMGAMPVLIGVFTGFLVSMYAAFLTIRKIYEIQADIKEAREGIDTGNGSF